MRVGALVALLGALVAWGHLWVSPKARLARYLDVSDTSSEEAIETDLLLKFPLWMSIQDVKNSLESRGLRQGGGSTRYYLSNAKGREQQDIDRATSIACVLDYNSGPIKFGSEYYLVWFLFDDEKRLTEIVVHEMYPDP